MSSSRTGMILSRWLLVPVVAVLVASLAFWAAPSVAGPSDSVRSAGSILAAKGGVTAAERVAANKTAGDAFRDTVTTRLETEYGFNIVGNEVRVKTPLGPRIIDILAERNGALISFETKLGGSHYLPRQRAKDWWISRIGTDVHGTGTKTKIPTVVIRGPLP